MQKKSISNKQNLFNFELQKKFSSKTTFIKPEDVKKSMLAIQILKEYIRFCYYDNYSFLNKHNLEKYCRLLLKYENSNQKILIKECQETCKTLILEALNKPYTLLTTQLYFAMKQSSYDYINEICNELMTQSTGKNIRSQNK